MRRIPSGTPRIRWPAGVPIAIVAGQETAERPGTPGRLAGSVEQMRYVFHELHAEARHALCEVCAN